MPSFGRVSDFFNLMGRHNSVGQDHAKQTGIALEKAYQFTLWLIPTVEKFPRTQKLLLATRLPFPSRFDRQRQTDSDTEGKGDGEFHWHFIESATQASY